MFFYIKSQFYIEPAKFLLFVIKIYSAVSSITWL